MKKKKTTKYLKHSFLILIIICSYYFSGNACSMYKITKDGKTIVGNNEDWISPNNQFWFVPSGENKYGVMNVGLINNFAQGAINDAGLVFDGFANPYLEVKNTADKIKIPIGEAVHYVMQSYNNVSEVKAYFMTIDLSSLSSGQLVFVDKTGAYLIVEGDELIIGNESEKIFSNFYYSQIESMDSVTLQNVKNGLDFVNNNNNNTPESSLSYCSSAMKSLANPDGFTQFSTLYDLNTLKIRVYLYHDYTEFVDVDLIEELAKGEHKFMIADLFSNNSKGKQHYLKYNNTQNPTEFLEDWIGDEPRTEDELVKNGFSYNLNVIGYEWLNDKEDTKGAIQIFKFGTEIMPHEANLFDSLGEAYLRDKNYIEAIKSYANALVLNPDNNNAIDMLVNIKNQRSNKK